MNKFEKIYKEAVTNVMATGNNQTTQTTTNPDAFKSSLLTDLKINPQDFQKIKQKLQQNLPNVQNIDQLFRLLANTDEENATTKTTNKPEDQQNKGQTGGQNPTLDGVQKQQSPSNPATKPLI
jgi:hypothetical protein